MSCCNDVGDVLALELGELVRHPDTTIGKVFSVLHCFRSILIRSGFRPLAQSNDNP